MNLLLMFSNDHSKLKTRACPRGVALKMQKHLSKMAKEQPGGGADSPLGRPLMLSKPCNSFRAKSICLEKLYSLPSMYQQQSNALSKAVWI